MLTRTAASVISILIFSSPDAIASISRDVDRERVPPRLAITKEVRELYNVLAPLRRDEQRRKMARLLPDVKAALWSHNLATYLNEHPELTPVQRRLIDDGLTFLAKPGLFHAFWSDPLHGDDVRQTVARHAERADAVFSREELYVLFLRLGAEPQESFAVSLSNAGVALPTQPNTLTTCECGTWFDCNFWYGRDCFHDPGFNCLPTVSGCGWYGNDACSGFCR